MRHHDSSSALDRALLAGWQAPDMLGIGVVVCDAECRVLLANETAQRILGRRHGLELSSDGLLCQLGPVSGTLAEAVRKCAEAETKAHESEDDSAVVIRESVGKAEIELRVRSFHVAGCKRAMALVVLLEPVAGAAEFLGISTYGSQYEKQPFSDIAPNSSGVDEHLPRYIEPLGFSKR